MGWKLNFHYKFYICHSLPACKHSRYFLVYRFLALFICVGGFVYLQPNCLPNFSRAHRNFPHVFAYTGRAYLFTINIARLVHARNSLTTPPPSPEAAKKSRSSRSFGSRSGRGRRRFERLSSKETPREKERGKKERKKREGMRLEARDDKSSVATCEYLNENARIGKRVDQERKEERKDPSKRSIPDNYRNEERRSGVWNPWINFPPGVKFLERAYSSEHSNVLSVRSNSSGGKRRRRGKGFSFLDSSKYA